MVEQAREVRLHPDVVARVPGQDLLHAVGGGGHARLLLVVTMCGRVEPSSVDAARPRSVRRLPHRQARSSSAACTGAALAAGLLSDSPRNPHRPCRRPHDRLDQPAVRSLRRRHHARGPHPQRACAARPGATGEFTSLLNAISLAIRIIHTRVRAAGLAGMLGYTGETNVQGEEVQKLDEFANDVLCTVLERSGRCAMVASEELEQARVLTETGQVHRLLRSARRLEQHRRQHLASAPSSASSARRPPAAACAEGALQPGPRIVAAGYARLRQRRRRSSLSTGHGRPRLHARPERRRVLPLAPEHPLPRCAATPTRSTRATSPAGPSR